MEMVLSSGQVSASALSTMVGHVAQKSTVCVKVIDSEGKISAINRAGLELLDVKSEDICGAVWSELWDGEMKTIVSNAVDEAFSGRQSSFIGKFAQGTLVSSWNVEVFPLEWRHGKVISILAISNRMSGAETDGTAELQAQMLNQMREALHAMSNLANVGASTARLLTRDVNADTRAQIAEGLQAASDNASEALEALKAVLGQATKS